MTQIERLAKIYLDSRTRLMKEIEKRVLWGRNFIGIELDADYFKIAEKRISDAQAQGMQLELLNVPKLGKVAL